MSRLEKTRVKMGGNLGPFNQELTRNIAQMRRRLDGDMQSKGYKAEQRKLRHEEFMKNLPRIQLERALGHMFDGTATPEDINYAFRHADEFAQAIAVIKPKTT